MTVFEAQTFQSRFSNRSALSLPATSNDFEPDDVGLACSPFSLSCAVVKRSCSVSPSRVSTLALRPAPCFSSSTIYQHGQITPTSPQVSALKADKTPFPPPLPNTWTWSPENSSCLAALPPTRSDAGPSNWYGSTLQSPEEILHWQRRHSSVSKPLLSPIRFSSDVEARPIDQREELPHPDQFEEIQTSSPYGDAGSSHSSDYDLMAPSRRLSYGEPLDMIEARSARKSIGSADFRSKAGWLAEDKSCDSWIDDTLKAQTARPYQTEPLRRKNRLWLDLVEDDEEIREAHATAVTTSPSKPRMISIRPRRATAESSPGETLSPTVSGFQPNVSMFLPATPPQSPTLSIETPERPPAPLNGSSIRTIDADKQNRQHQAFNRIRSHTIWSMTTPQSDISTCWSPETVRRIIPVSPTIPPSPNVSRPATPPPMPMNTGLKLSELTTWILTELETCVFSKANQSLQLEDPVIQQLRLPPKQRKIPRPQPLVPARSSFSATQGPLSSHTSPSQFAAPPADASESTPAPTVPAAPDATHAILNRIFPFASKQTLSTLLAAILAHKFVSTIHIPLLQQTASIASFPFAVTHTRTHSPTTTILQQFNGLPEHIPSKARAMLGLPPPSSPGKPKDGRPPLPAFWRKVEKRQWSDRVGELEAGLREKVRNHVGELVGADEWKSGERGLDALVSAVGEAVTMGDRMKQGERVGVAL